MDAVCGGALLVWNISLKPMGNYGLAMETESASGVIAGAAVPVLHQGFLGCLHYPPGLEAQLQPMELSVG